MRQISAKVARAGLEGLYGVAEQQGGGSGDTQKKLDVVAVGDAESQLLHLCGFAAAQQEMAVWVCFGAANSSPAATACHQATGMTTVRHQRIGPADLSTAVKLPRNTPCTVKATMMLQNRIALRTERHHEVCPVIKPKCDSAGQ